jgi:hypothetical protein
VAAAAPRAKSWRPASDDELTWLRVGGILPTHPRPLELTGAVHAFTYGLTHALESLYFPLYEIRERSIDGQLYLAVVPSGLADRDIEARIKNVNDRTIRFRDILGTWRGDIREEALADLERMKAFTPKAATGEEMHEAWLRLRRIRANQWFAPTRAVVCPTALLKGGVGKGNLDEALQAIDEVQQVVVEDGTKAFDGAVDRVGQQLTGAGCIDAANDVLWLDFDEVSQALETGVSYRETVAQRKKLANSTGQSHGPEVVGPPLVRDDRRLFLLPEIFELLGVTSPL